MAAREQEERRRSHQAALAEEAYKAKLALLRDAQARSGCAQRCARKAVEENREKQQQQQQPQQQKSNNNELEAINHILGSLFGIQLDQSASTAQPEAPQQVEQAKKEKKVTIAAPESASAPTPTPAQCQSSACPCATKATETTATKPAKSTPEKPTTEPETAKSDEPAFPESINDLLSHFLGLRIEPESYSATPAEGSSAQANGVPEGLNDFLEQYGLVFEPDQYTIKEDKGESSKTASTAEDVKQGSKEVSKDAEHSNAVPATSATQPSTQPSVSATPATAPAESSTKSNQDRTAPTQTPLTDFLNGVADLPPFVRDILGNVELAFKEEGKKADSEKKEPVKQDKGKGVAEGEKTERPSTTTPSPPAPVEQAAASAPTTTETTDSTEPDSTDSISKLESIAHELHLATSSFTFPPTLSFAPSPSSSETPAPALLYNRLNKPYHAQNNKLLELLLAADSISSNGDKSVRSRRKELVKEVEKALEELEKKRDEVWAEVKAKRERGEESDDDEAGWSSTSGSVVDHEEGHTEETVNEATETAEATETVDNNTQDKSKEENHVEEQKEQEQEQGKDDHHATYAEVASHAVHQDEQTVTEGHEVESEVPKEKVTQEEVPKDEVIKEDGVSAEKDKSDAVVNEEKTVAETEKEKEKPKAEQKEVTKEDSEEGYELL